MNKFFEIDWRAMFLPTESLIEIFIRGTVMYLVMFGLLRLFRRKAGSIGIADLLVIVVIADAAQNGMAGDSKSITEAVLLIMTIVLWNYFIDFLGDRFEFFERLLSPPPLEVIRNGRLMHRNMRREMITVGEIESQMRQQGIENVGDVKMACLESDGHFSFIKKDGTPHSGDEKRENVVIKSDYEK